MKTNTSVKEFSIITLAILLVSVAVYFFMIPSGIVVGSVSGLAIVFSNLVPLSVPKSLSSSTCCF